MAFGITSNTTNLAFPTLQRREPDRHVDGGAAEVPGQDQQGDDARARLVGVRQPGGARRRRQAAQRPLLRRRLQVRDGKDHLFCYLVQRSKIIAIKIKIITCDLYHDLQCVQKFVILPRPYFSQLYVDES